MLKNLRLSSDPVRSYLSPIAVLLPPVGDSTLLRGDCGHDAMRNPGDRGLLPCSSLHSSASSAMLTSHIITATVLVNTCHASTHSWRTRWLAFAAGGRRSRVTSDLCDPLASPIFATVRPMVSYVYYTWIMVWRAGNVHIPGTPSHSSFRPYHFWPHSFHSFHFSTRPLAFLLLSSYSIHFLFV